MAGWSGGNHVKSNATLWPNLQNNKISIRVEIPKLDLIVAIHRRGKEHYITMVYYNV